MLPFFTAALEVLVNRSLESKSEYVFANQRSKPYLVTFLDHLHKKLREDDTLKERLQLPKDCVIHSLGHTFLTRFGEAGADAFTIKKVAGHSSVTISERYIHPTPEGQGRGFERFANLNQTAVEKAENDAESLQIPLHSKWRPPLSCCAPVAQRLEQQTHNLLVRGSNPCGGTISQRQ